MACEICGRGNCTKSFHSLSDQSNYDDVADSIKERVSNRIHRNIDRLKFEYIDDVAYVKLDDALEATRDY